MNDLERSLADYATFLDERSLARSGDHTSERHEGDVIMIETQIRESEILGDNGRDRRPRWPWVMTFAAAAVAIVVLVAVIGLTTNESTQFETVDDPELDEPSPAVDPALDDSTLDPTDGSEPVVDEGDDETVDETLDPVVEEHLAIATAFMEAFGRGDFDEASQYLVQTESGGAEAGVWTGFSRSIALLGDEIEWMTAVDWRVDVDACVVEQPDPSNTLIDCQFLYDTAWGRALGLEPYPGSFRLRINKGEMLSGVFGELEDPAIVDLTHEFPWESFVDEVMGPFTTWLEANHPDDVASMFAPAQFGMPMMPYVWPELHTLWAQRTEEFVADQGQ